MLYEAKPYLLLVASFACLIGANYSALPIILTTCACLLFYIGALVWMMRSRHRRRDQAPEQRRHLSRGPFFPFYEWKPFLLLTAGAALPSIWNELLIYLIAGMLCSTGVLLLIIRTRYRSRSWRHLVQDIADADGTPVEINEIFSNPTSQKKNLDDNPYAVMRKPCLRESCGIHQYCQSLPLKEETINECMRLLQYMEPKHVAQHIKDHNLSPLELESLLSSLQQQAGNCATWSKSAKKVPDSPSEDS